MTRHIAAQGLCAQPLLYGFGVMCVCVCVCACSLNVGHL